MSRLKTVSFSSSTTWVAPAGVTRVLVQMGYPNTDSGYKASIYKDIAVGGSNAFGLRTSDGSAWAWGSGTNGVLGQNTNVTNSSSPVSVVGGISFSSLIASGSTVNLLGGGIQGSDGSAWMWGTGTFGQLGNNGTVSLSSPVSVLGGISFTKLVCNTHVLGIRGSDGSIWGWGNNAVGQLGDNTIAQRQSPVSVVGGISFVDISAGGSHSAGIRGSDGSLWTWGSNTAGQLGNSTITNASSPVSVVGGHSFVDVSCANNTTFALKADGTLWAWGSNTSFAFADGGPQVGNDRSSPVQVTSNIAFLPPQVAGDHFSFIDTSGNLVTWGVNTNGALGAGYLVGQSSPISVTGRSWSKVGVGNLFTIGLSEGLAFGWGSNSVGQLGNKTLTNAIIPVLTYPIAASPSLVSGVGSERESQKCVLVDVTPGTSYSISITTAAAGLSYASFSSLVYNPGSIVTISWNE